MQVPALSATTLHLTWNKPANKHSNSSNVGISTIQNHPTDLKSHQIMSSQLLITLVHKIKWQNMNECLLNKLMYNAAAVLFKKLQAH